MKDAINIATIKKIISWILYVIVLFYSIVYFFWLWKTIDDKLWFWLNQNIYNSVNRWMDILKDTRDEIDFIISGISFRKKWKAEDYIYEK